MSSFEVNTKLEAYKLIHDPTKLLSLLYSKYRFPSQKLLFLYMHYQLYK